MRWILLIAIVGIVAGCVGGSGSGGTAYQSEGTATSPVNLGTGELHHEGTVAGGEYSYYSYTSNFSTGVWDVIIDMMV